MAEETKSTEYLTFRIGNETYAVNVGNVREVLEYTKITSIPRTAAYMRGVINVRGSVVPVIDLKQKFGLGETEDLSVDTSIVVMEVPVEGEVTVLGALVDGVDEVIDIPPENVDLPPRLGSHISAQFVEGVARRDEEFIMLLDTARVFTADELSRVSEASA